jgi:ATP-binding cassette, subfamily B, multidrug efflux pump
MTEKKKKLTNQLQLLKRLLNLAQFEKKWIIFAVSLTIIQSLLTATQPYLYKIVIDQVILANRFNQLNFWCSILLGWLIIQAGLGFINAYLSERIAQSIILKLRQFVYDHLIRLKLSFFDKTPVGTAVTRSISDIQTITDLFSSGIITILGDMVQIIAILWCMFYISVKLTFLTLLVIPLLMYSANKFRKGIRDTFQDVRNQVANLNAFLQERITGMQIVQLFNQEKREFHKFKDINKKHQDANIKSIFYYSIFFPIVEVLIALAFAIIVAYGSTAIFNQSMKLGELTAFIMFINLFFRPIRAIADRFNNIQMGIVSAERIFQLVDSEDNIEKSGNIIPQKIEGNIEFQNVWFAYNEENWILRDISFAIQSGKSMAIVGATGSGKTTIANLVTQMYQHQKGNILIDGINVNDYDYPSLRKRIAVVLQDVFLFSGSIKSNLVLKNSEVSSAEIEKVAKEIGAYDFIEKLPGGFDFNVMERGLSLSQGQRQLISFIRALAMHPDMIVLDEATSSIDSHTEEMIQRAIAVLLKNRSAIVIAHRLSTIQNCDEILVLEKGEIMERGNHETLISKKGMYWNLYQKQFEG